MYWIDFRHGGYTRRVHETNIQRASQLANRQLRELWDKRPEGVSKITVSIIHSESRTLMYKAHINATSAKRQFKRRINVDHVGATGALDLPGVRRE